MGWVSAAGLRCSEQKGQRAAGGENKSINPEGEKGEKKK